MLARFNGGLAEVVAHAAEDHGHPEVAADIRKAVSSGKLPQLLALLAPVVIALIMGTPVDWLALAAQIQALLGS